MTVLTAQRVCVPTIKTSPLSALFWNAVERGELTFQRCSSCGQANFDPTPNCRWCLSTDLTWETSAGTGTIESWTVVWRAPLQTFEVPYAPALVRLDEGYRMIAQLVHCDTEAIRTGLRVRATFPRPDSGVTIPCFQPFSSDAPGHGQVSSTSGVVWRGPEAGV